MMIVIAHLRMARFFSATVQWIYLQIDWDLLVMFIGLFVVIGGVSREDDGIV